jgi:hypothetical protein
MVKLSFEYSQNLIILVHIIEFLLFSQMIKILNRKANSYFFTNLPLSATSKSQYVPLADDHPAAERLGIAYCAV